MGRPKTSRRKAKDRSGEETDEDESSLRMLHAITPLRRMAPEHLLSREHRVVQEEDYAFAPISSINLEQENFAANLGLVAAKASCRFKRRSGILDLPLKLRRQNVTCGALPLTTGSVFAMAKYSGKTVFDVTSYVRKKDKKMLSYSILWPDEKFKKQVSEIPKSPPTDEYELPDMSWIHKRKKFAELERERRKKEEEEAQEQFVKRRQLMNKLRSYPERELRGMFPKLNQECQVLLDPITKRTCEVCGWEAFAVGSRLLHKCPNFIELN